jgi:hypothetical protein
MVSCGAPAEVRAVNWQNLLGLFDEKECYDRVVSRIVHLERPLKNIELPEVLYVSAVWITFKDFFMIGKIYG